MKYVELENVIRNTEGKYICLFGAGLIGCTWAYDLLKQMGCRIDFYCDNNKEADLVIRDEIRTISLEALYSLKENVLVFITVGSKNQESIRNQLKKNGVHSIVQMDYLFLQIFIESLNDTDDLNLKKKFQFILDDEEYICRQFKYKLGYELNIKNPTTLNEKIQWLKINDRKPIYTQLADKFLAREFIKEKFGEEYLVPLLYTTSDWRDIIPDNIPNEPCIIKTNHSSGDYQIIRDRGTIDWKKIRMKYEKELMKNFYYANREFQYKNIKPMIIIERLLMLSNGKIPNDYKLHFFNGRCEFIYCSIDREGANYRKVYDINWQPLEFAWASEVKNLKSQQGPDIPRPGSFEKMLNIGYEIAKNMKYVRVDFFDVDGKLYCGEITLHHGAGYDAFYPEKYDLYYGQKLSL